MEFCNPDKIGDNSRNDSYSQTDKPYDPGYDKQWLESQWSI